ncbi:hypothetical protein D1872_353010 [compost metagenome]
MIAVIHSPTTVSRPVAMATKYTPMSPRMSFTARLPRSAQRRNAIPGTPKRMGAMSLSRRAFFMM